MVGDIEAQAGGAFETFVPVSYSSQVVAGTNFFVKVRQEVDLFFLFSYCLD